MHDDLGISHPQPEWFPLPAVGRLRISSAREEQAFRAYNAFRPYAHRVRPFNFLNLYHAHRVVRAGRSGPRCLVAPFGREAAKWLKALTAMTGLGGPAY